jgi:hypothetical protein
MASPTFHELQALDIDGKPFDFASTAGQVASFSRLILIYSNEPLFCFGSACIPVAGLLVLEPGVSGRPVWALAGRCGCQCRVLLRPDRPKLQGAAEAHLSVLTATEKVGIELDWCGWNCWRCSGIP